MLLPLKPICSASKARRDGTSLIFLQYCKTETKKTLLNTEIAIPSQYWSKKLCRVKDDLPPAYGNAQEVNLELHRMFRLAEDIIHLANKLQIEDTVSFAKKTFRPHLTVAELKAIEKNYEALKPGQNLDFFYQLDVYIKSKEKKVSEGTLGVFKQMKEHLLAFETFRKKPITFECIDLDFYEKLVDYLALEYVQKRRKQLTKGLKLNTIGKTIKQLRIFLKNRSKRKVILPIDLDGFKILEEEADAIYLTEAEIQRIYSLDLSKHPHLIKYRDLLVFGCLTGLRFSDFSTIGPQDVRENKLYKKQEKSDHWVVVPLRPEAHVIFVHNFKRIIPRITNPDFNYYIKEVGKLASLDETITFSHKRGNKDIVEVKPKYEWITSHTCRRSFCTNEFLAGTPVKLIMKVSGHKKESDFYRYIKISAEQAAMQIEKIWGDRRIEIEK